MTSEETFDNALKSQEKAHLTDLRIPSRQIEQEGDEKSSSRGDPEAKNKAKAWILSCIRSR